MPDAQSPDAPAARKIPTRRISFEESLQDLPRHFAGNGNIFASHLMASLSSVFPDGEDYFVRSVRHFRDQVSDPQLKKQVAGFIGQEAVHGREHRALNRRLSQLGYPTKQAEWVTRRGLAIRERIATPKANLAATAALEHFTATLAEIVLSNQEVQEQLGHPEVRNLFMWHALEESEHKAVAFDVYKTVGGSERTRVVTMHVLRFGFVVGMLFQTLISMLFDPATYNPRRLRRDFREFRRSVFMRKEVWETLRDYCRHDFHPDDHDTNALVEVWRERLFGTKGSLNDKLVGSAA
ncbi:MAG: metal-dependent hydrolase [Acidimicrobiales bacterium]